MKIGNKRYKLKRKIKNNIYKLWLFILIIIFLISIVNIFRWLNDNKNNIDETNAINEKVEIITVPDNEYRDY